MKILLSGSSGFLGKLIYKELVAYGDVITISRTKSTLNVDLAKEIPTLPCIDMVIHAAGKAHVVPRTEKENIDFFNVNLEGTRNLLKGLDQSHIKIKSFLFISTVAVYGLDQGIEISESHPLLANDSYGKSKILTESLVKDWCEQNNVVCTILRLPLLIGEGAPGNLGSMIEGIRKGYYFNIAGGTSRKSMVLASDVAKAVYPAAQRGGIYNLTDGYHPSFYELSYVISDKINKKKPTNIPLWLAKIIALLGNLLGEKAPLNTKKLKKITTDLTFDDSKARIQLNWNPSHVLNGFNKY